MIPLLAVVRWRRNGGLKLGVWVPLFLLWLLILPFVVLLLPVVILLLAIAGAKPFRVIAACWNFLVALRGTRIDVASRDRTLFIRII